MILDTECQELNRYNSYSEQPIFYATDIVDNFSGCPESDDIMYRYYIYTLNDKTGVRYVGQTRGPRERLSQHMCNARNNRDKTKRGLWIKSLVEAKTEPTMIIVETCPIYQANEREQFWINHYRQRGASLVNSSRWDKPREGSGWPKGRPRKKD